MLAGLCVLVAGAPVVAESFGSSAASSVSSAGSAASGSVSDSLKGSSGSSGGQARVAQGAYRVLAVEAVPDRPGVVEMRLRPELPLALGAAPTVASAERVLQAEAQAQRAAEAQALASGAQDLWLRLPRSAMGPVALGAGDRVWAQVHGYGVAFARGAQRADSPFYLVLHDSRQHDLSSRVLSL